MKVSGFVLFLLLFWSAGRAQNLVPNPSFEEYVICPTTLSQIYRAVHWFQPQGATSDYFNACSIFEPAAVPKNTIGYQFARTGDGYGGFLGVVSVGAPADYREYLEVELLEPLTEGVRYDVSFFVSLSENSGLAIHSIGAYFSTDSINDSTNLMPLPYTPQVQNPARLFLDDTMSWTRVSGTFVASGREKFMTIGNFKPLTTTDTIGVESDVQVFQSAHYFVDDVCVVEVPKNLNDFTLGKDTAICQDEKFTVVVTDFGPNFQYRWQDESFNRSIEITEPGKYWLEVSGCSPIVSDTLVVTEKVCDTYFEMPNLFTPNGDHINDFFVPIKSIGIQTAKTKIYNRWGNQVFESDIVTAGWNGNLSNGNEANKGIYFWTVEYVDIFGNTTFLSGSLTLLR